MNRDILALDFYGQTVMAAVASLDEKTDTIRIRHVTQLATSAFLGAFVRDRSGAQDDLTRLFEELSAYTSSASVIVGVRGNFLSFQHSTGFTYTQSRSHIIRPSDIENAIEESLPKNLDDSLEVLDILPQSYIIDDQPGATDPVGMYGYCIGVETFISFGVASHLTNLRNVLEACGCNDFQWMPSSVALAETGLTPAEKAATTLLLDIGENSVSALLYHKDSLLEAWELPFGLNILAEGISDQLQNDFQTALEVLRHYEPDPILDEMITDASDPLLTNLQKQLVQSLPYLQHPPTHIVLAGQGALPIMQKLVKNKLGIRKIRLCSFDKLIADCEVDIPQYNGVLALLEHFVAREQNQLGVTQVKEEGLLGKLFSKLGFN